MNDINTSFKETFQIKVLTAYCIIEEMANDFYYKDIQYRKNNSKLEQKLKTNKKL